MQTPAKRNVVAKACDACRKRKTKCNGAHPCAGCLVASLICTFNMPRGLGGNRGSRATVLNELRRCQEHDSLNLESTPQISTPESGSSEGLDIDFEAYIAIYLERIFPVVPLLSESMLTILVRDAKTTQRVHQMLLAFCAYVKNFGVLKEEDAQQFRIVVSKESAKIVLDAAICERKLHESSEADPISVHSSFFLYGAWAGQGNYHQAWYYLREATTLFTMMSPRLDEHYTAKEHRHLFWILLISERSHAVRRNRPITLSVSLNGPILESEDPQGLQHLANLFRPLDETFFAVWNNSSQECSKDWLLRRENDIRCALPPYLNVSDEEMANLRVSQSWLRIKLWELFPRFGFLSTESVYECLTFRYPILVARDLLLVTNQLLISSLKVHGVGLTEKVFDVACAAADVLPFLPLVSPHDGLDPVGYLIQTASLLQQLPNGLTKFIPLLLVKVNELNSEVARVLCDRMEMPSLLFDNPMSPDTRFIYEEEVGQALYIDLRKGR